MGEEPKYAYIVIGGGIGGLAAALSLAELGESICVLEKAPEFSEIGAGLQLAPNALAALDKLGVLEKVKEKAVFPKNIVLLDAVSGQALSSLDLGEAFQKRYGYPYIVTHRSDLHAALLEACKTKDNITLLNNKEVHSVVNNDEQAQVICADGTNYYGQVVVGADGLWSNTRKLLSNDQVVCSEFVAYRGTIPTSEISKHAHFEDVVCWIGPDLHLVQYPVRNKELYNQVVVFKSYNFRENSDDWGTPEELDRRFSQCCAEVKHATSFIERQRRWPLYDREPITSWVNGRFTLLGDAAHPMLQYLAQGACQALEDSIVLGNKLHQYGHDVENALQAYQEERIPRTASVQTNARKFGEILHTSDPITIMVRNELLRIRNPQDYHVVDWLYNYKA